MTTFGDAVQQVKSLLRSYTGVQEQLTYLTQSCASDDLVMSVNDSSVVSMGISELEDELVYVEVSESNTLTIPPFGRGFNGTTAAAHALNTMVTFDPIFPMIEVKRAINQTLQGTYPMLFTVKAATFSFNPAQATYELPADCDKVLRVTYDMTGPSQHWPAISGWDFDPHATDATGKSITLLEAPEPGRTVQVIYQAGFAALSENTDTLTDIGFPESAVDVLLYGACAKLVRFIDIARLQTGSVENISRSQLVGVGDASKLANQLLAVYQQRLSEERKKLLDNDKPQMYFTR